MKMTVQAKMKIKVKMGALVKMGMRPNLLQGWLRFEPRAWRAWKA